MWRLSRPCCTTREQWQDLRRSWIVSLRSWCMIWVILPQRNTLVWWLIHALKNNESVVNAIKLKGCYWHLSQNNSVLFLPQAGVPGVETTCSVMGAAVLLWSRCSMWSVLRVSPVMPNSEASLSMHWTKRATVRAVTLWVLFLFFCTFFVSLCILMFYPSNSCFYTLFPLSFVLVHDPSTRTPLHHATFVVELVFFHPQSLSHSVSSSSLFIILSFHLTFSFPLLKMFLPVLWLLSIAYLERYFSVAWLLIGNSLDLTLVFQISLRAHWSAAQSVRNQSWTGSFGQWGRRITHAVLLALSAAAALMVFRSLWMPLHRFTALRTFTGNRICAAVDIECWNQCIHMHFACLGSCAFVQSYVYI